MGFILLGGLSVPSGGLSRLGLVLACVAYAAATYGALPARVPMHFKLDGTADRFLGLLVRPGRRDPV